MTEHKDQHFIPQCYQKAWCDPETPPKFEPYVWVFTKDGSDVDKTAPKNVFYEKDMYTIATEDGKRNLVLEHGLAELESRFASLRDEKVAFKRNLLISDRITLCAFAAAMTVRTQSHRDYQKSQWGKALEMMDDMIEFMKDKTPQEKRTLITEPGNGPSLSYEEVKKLSSKPLQSTLPTEISNLTQLYLQMNWAIFENDLSDGIGFITSDNPCNWFDPELWSRPPMFQSLGLGYPKIEVTLPISPKQLLFLSKSRLSGYLPIRQKIVDELNRRTRGYCYKDFAVRKNFKNPFWFEMGKKPKDAWD